MKKIQTLYKKDEYDLGRVVDEINPHNQWVFDGFGIPTRKFDGTAVAIIDGELYKRYDVKWNRSVPDGAIPCQEPDGITGHWPHWVKCDRSKPEDKWHWVAWDMETAVLPDGTYELCGPKIGDNRERFDVHILVPHGIQVLWDCNDYSFDGLYQYLLNNDIEGIVFHHKYDPSLMCKIRKSDFGIKR